MESLKSLHEAMGLFCYKSLRHDVRKSILGSCWDHAGDILRSRRMVIICCRRRPEGACHIVNNMLRPDSRIVTDQACGRPAWRRGALGGGGGSGADGSCGGEAAPSIHDRRGRPSRHIRAAANDAAEGSNRAARQRDTSEHSRRSPRPDEQWHEKWSLTTNL